MRIRGNIRYLIFYAVVAVASFVYWQQTRNNHINTPTDSMLYMEIAGNICRGDGFKILQNGELRPYTFHPPLFPLLISAVASGMDCDVFSASRIIAGFLLIITLWGLFIIFDLLSVKPVYQLLGFVLFLFSWVGELYYMVLSEQLFNVWLLLLLYVLLKWERSQKASYLLYAGMLLGLATLTRYAGLGIVAGVLLWVFIRSGWRLKNFLYILLPFLLLLVPWFWFSEHATGSAFERTWGFHPPGYIHIKQLTVTLANWKTPGWTRVLLPLVLPVGSILVYKLYRQYKKGVLSPGKLLMPEMKMMLVMIATYFLFILISITFVDYDIPLDTRILAPVYLMGLILFIMLMQKIFRYEKSLTVFMLAIIILSYGVDYAQKSRYRFRLVEKEQAWKKSGIIRYLKKKHPAKIYTNATDIIKFYTDLDTITYEVPVKFSRMSLKPNEHYAGEMEKLRREVRQGKATIVHFKGLNPRPFQPGETDWKKFFPERTYKYLYFKRGFIILEPSSHEKP